jgi:hypothetical protein
MTQSNEQGGFMYSTWYLIGALFISAAAPPKTTTATELITKLGDVDFYVREAATQELLRRPDTRADLGRAMYSSDQEIARRARRILEIFAHRDKSRLLVLAQKAGKKRNLEQIVDLVTEIPLKSIAAESDFFEPISSSTSRLVRQARSTGRCQNLESLFPGGSFFHFLGPSDELPEWIVGSKVELHDKEADKIIVSRQLVTPVDGRIFHSLILNDSDIVLRGVVSSVIVANGNIEIDKMYNSVLICSGSCRIRKAAHSSLICVGGQITVIDAAQMDDCVLAAKPGNIGNKQRLMRNNEIRDDPGSLANFVTFFDPAVLGVGLKKHKRGVEVSHISPTSILGQAGLCAGDVIVKIDGQPPISSEVCYVLLRKGFSKIQFQISILRHEKPFVISVDPK